MEFLSGLLGALVGGLFVLGGSLLQGRLHAKQTEARFEHERRLAAEDHARKQAWTENERLRGRLEDQMAYGRKVIVAAGRFQLYVSQGKGAKASTEMLTEAVRFAGLKWDEVVPYASWLHPEEIEDSDLRALVSEHRGTVEELDKALIAADVYPDKLPADCISVQDQIDGLARRIDARCRQLQREGKPL